MCSIIGITAVRAVSNMQSVGFRKPLLFLRHADSELVFWGSPYFHPITVTVELIIRNITF